MFDTVESFNKASIENILDCLKSIQKDEVNPERWLERFYTWSDLMAYWMGMLHFRDINWSDVWEMCQPIAPRTYQQFCDGMPFSQFVDEHPELLSKVV